ncbi:YqiA/YcfP family alpha/beta fold hydrolase [Wenzhouxiangella limi]|uniref:Palmitoyl-protein thioesterase ABHD10, mitochondrial n=1 Tax=Wenzhouxiangella limi TaxID=2707351 RepID=A0A845V269_9GAMM|nr:YqiA/YcfP family alpha/beta fold hydrolase [Wenzhouxiangella limi]NDY96360.1 alpha/beta fold hydrolase [Wenzhouxiangella limi]
MHLIFSHGHLSSPDSHKIRTLAPLAEAAGLTTEAIDYRDLRDDAAGRVQRLCARLNGFSEPAVLVGSSMGGYVSVAAACRMPVRGLFLLAPAVYLNDRYPDAGLIEENYPVRCQAISVVHGWRDEVIPWHNARRFAEERRASLHLLDTDHRMADAMATISELFSLFLKNGLNRG